MADTAVGMILQCTLRGQQDAQTTLTVLHFRLEADPTPAPIYAALGAFNTHISSGVNNLWTRYLNCISNVWEATSITSQIIYPIRYVGQSLLKGGEFGSVSGTALPVGNMVAITKRAEIAGPHGVGGVRMPGVPTSHAFESMVTANGFLAYNIMALELTDNQTPTGGQNWNPIIFNRSSPATSAPIESASTQPQIRTMSRRVVGRGI